MKRSKRTDYDLGRAIREAAAAIEAYSAALEAAKWRRWRYYWLKVAGLTEAEA